MTEKDKNYPQQSQSVEELLQELARDDVSTETQPDKLWSIDDIDALLSAQPREPLEEPVPELDTVPQEVPAVVASAMGDPMPAGQSFSLDLSHIPDSAVAEADSGMVDLLAEPRAYTLAAAQAETSMELEPTLQTKKNFRPIVQVTPFKTRNNPDDIFVVLSSEFGKTHAAIATEHLGKNFWDTTEFEPLEDEAPVDTGPIEKPGLILEKGAPAKTGDLEPLPKILSAQDVLQAAQEGKTILAAPKAKSEPEPHPESPPDTDFPKEQIVFSAFQQLQEEPPQEQVSEQDMELELYGRRKEKIRSFTLQPDSAVGETAAGAASNIEFSPDTNDEQETEDTTGTEKGKAKRKLEYTKTADRRKILQALRADVKRANGHVFGLVVLLLTALFHASLPLLMTRAGFLLPDVLEPNSLISLGIHLVLLLLACFICSGEIGRGFAALFRGKPDQSTALVLTCLAALAGNIVFLAIPQPTDTAAGLCGLSAIFAMLCNTLSLRSNAKRKLNSFQFAAIRHANDLYAVDHVSGEQDLAEIGKGILMDTPELLYSGKIEFPNELFAQSDRNDTANRFCRQILLVGVLASLAVGAVAYWFSRDIALSVTALTVVLAISCPLSLYLVLSGMQRKTNQRLVENGSTITSIDSAQDLVLSNAVMVSASDLFSRKDCAMHGMKDYHTVRVDDIILYAAAITMQSGSPLMDVFEQIIVGQNDVLPRVKKLRYEDKMGMSGWIQNQKVLLGNRNLMLFHNIDVPPQEEAERYCKKGRNVLYLAISGKLAALFVVSYAADKSLQPMLQEIVRHDLHLLISTCDPNITEELIRNEFGLQSGKVKIISAKAARFYQKQRDTVRPSAVAKILHDGSAHSFFQSIAAALRLEGCARFLTAANAVIVAAAIAAVLATAIVSQPLPHANLLLFAFHVTSSLLLLLLGRIQRGRLPH